MKEEVNLEEVVRALNTELFETDGEENTQFEFTTTGFAQIITFGEMVVWSSEDDNREFFEDLNEYEPMETFIRKEFNKRIDHLATLKFK